MELATQLTTTEHLRRELEEDVMKHKNTIAIAGEKVNKIICL